MTQIFLTICPGAITNPRLSAKAASAVQATMTPLGTAQMIIYLFLWVWDPFDHIRPTVPPVLGTTK